MHVHTICCMSGDQLCSRADGRESGASRSSLVTPRGLNTRHWSVTATRRWIQVYILLVGNLYCGWSMTYDLLDIVETNANSSDQESSSGGKVIGGSLGCRVLSVDCLVGRNKGSQIRESRSLTGSPVHHQSPAFTSFGSRGHIELSSSSPWSKCSPSETCSASSNSLTSRSPGDGSTGDDIASLQSLIKGITSGQRPRDGLSSHPVFRFQSPMKTGGASPVSYSPPFLGSQTLVSGWYSHGCRELAYHGHSSSTLYPVCM